MGYVIFVIAKIILLLLSIKVISMASSPEGVNFNSRKDVYFCIAWVFVFFFDCGLNILFIL